MWRDIAMFAVLGSILQVAMLHLVAWTWWALPMLGWRPWLTFVLPVVAALPLTAVAELVWRGLAARGGTSVEPRPQALPVGAARQAAAAKPDRAAVQAKSEREAVHS